MAATRNAPLPSGPRIFHAFTVAVFIALSTSTRGEDIEGVQPAALDQPRINLIVRRQAKGRPLSAKAGGEETFNLEAFLDTGASGIVLSVHSADQLGIKRETTAGAKPADAQFEDVGVGGGSRFGISEAVYLSMAAYTPNTNTENIDSVNLNYLQSAGPFRTQIGPLDTGNDLLASLVLGNLDIVGTPAMQGKVMVMDTKEVNNMTDKIRTYLYDPKVKSNDGPGIPKTKRHIKLSYASFKEFTKTIPPSAEAPAVFANPFIGPNPLKPAGDATPPVIVTHKGRSSQGSWLLDTGAAASMISRTQATAVGVNYTAGTFGTDHPTLDGVPADQQFVMTVSGIGGAKKAAGFYLDKLALRMREGQPLVYIRAPVLIADITVKNPATGREMTLDGVFGMNFLVASCKIDESALLPDLDKLTPGAFRWIVYDQSAGLLGLE